jgi:hypothetical protein
VTLQPEAFERMISGICRHGERQVIIRKSRKGLMQPLIDGWIQQAHAREQDELRRLAGLLRGRRYAALKAAKP